MSLPRTRGDEPFVDAVCTSAVLSAPHPRG